MPDFDRYHRQSILPQIGGAGQRRLRTSSALVVGCGALGCAVADQLARAGVGRLALVDRDLVESTNLQRQALFDEADARDAAPKAAAAASRLKQINSEVQVEPLVIDLDAEWIAERLAKHRPDVIIDATDNAETRYLLNDAAVQSGTPWVYGACVGTEGRAMAIRSAEPGWPCLRCVFPEPPAAGELPTCDTAGVLGPVAMTVGSIQAACAIKLLSGNGASVAPELISLDLWSNQFRVVSVDGAKNPDCPTCGKRNFEFLDRPPGSGGSARLCGRDAVQVRPAGRSTNLDLDAMASKLASAGHVEKSDYLVRCDLREPEGFRLTLFRDGRLIVQGTTDVARARAIYARFVGS